MLPRELKISLGAQIEAITVVSHLNLRKGPFPPRKVFFASNEQVLFFSCVHFYDVYIYLFPEASHKLSALHHDAQIIHQKLHQ